MKGSEPDQPCSPFTLELGLCQGYQDLELDLHVCVCVCVCVCMYIYIFDLFIYLLQLFPLRQL